MCMCIQNRFCEDVVLRHYSAPARATPALTLTRLVCPPFPRSDQVMIMDTILPWLVPMRFAILSVLLPKAVVS